MNILRRPILLFTGAVLLAASIACQSGEAFASSRRRAVSPIRPRTVAGISATVQFPPQPVKAAGAQQLAWEVIFRNDSGREVTLEQVEVLSGGSGNVLAAYSGSTLRPLLMNLPPRPATSTRPAERIGTGEAAILFFLVAVPSLEEIPPVLDHRIRFTSGSSQETLRGIVTQVRATPPPVLIAPLAGGPWKAFNALSIDSPHRRAGAAVDGRTTFAQRYAIDWARIDAGGKTYSGDKRNNRSYYSYGVDVLAPADGVVTFVKDGIPDNVPQQAPRVPITVETITGNYVTIDIGGNQFLVAAHLQPGSLAVRPGDHVTRGMLLGRLGNSGNSTEPHLHIHLCDANSNLGCEGLPYVLDHYTTPAGPRQLELPMKDEVAVFD
ncbi:MAG TPA: M23 family metallopeptidase [Thermoanaerobaculia bacterium]|jgi:murein DD-endopeptidase MepM/ murein hydrolase activator NlpD